MRKIVLLLTALAFVAFAAACSKKKTDTTPSKVSTAAPGTDRKIEIKEGPEEEADPSEEVSLRDRIYFEFDSAELSAEARSRLESNAEWLKQNPGTTLTIEGHTDEVGTTEYNIALGERRAKAAHDYLVRLGIDPDRVRILSFGEEKPASTNDAENRRDEFVPNK